MQKSKMAVGGGLTNSCEKKRSEKQRRKGKIHPFECRVPKNTANLDSILKSRDITLSTKVRLVNAMVFPVVMYGCES